MINQERLKRIFIDILNINSVSLREKQLSTYIKHFAIENKIPFYEDASSGNTGSDTNNIVLRLDGSGKSKPLFFSAHIDTVESTSDLQRGFGNGKYYSKTDTILGGDDKAGIAAILETFLSLKSLPKSEHRTVEAVFTVAEEIGLVGAKNFDTKLLRARQGFVLDAEGDIGNAVIAGPAHFIFNCIVRGKAAHAGIEPEKGINAIKAAAWLINKMPSGRLGAFFTANIGKITGGQASNIVPESVTFTFEVRSVDEPRCLAYIENVKLLAKRVEMKFGVKCSFSGGKEYSVYSIDMDAPILKLFSQSCKKNDVTPHFLKSTGGSDAGIFNNAGLEAIDIAVGMRAVHSTDEFIYLKDIEKVCRIIFDTARLN